jgi:hypothetical protein
VLARHLLLVALCFFFTILLSSTIQTLARRHHLPLITPQTELTPLPCFSPSVTSKINRNKKRREKKENERERIEP